MSEFVMVKRELADQLASPYVSVRNQAMYVLRAVLAQEAGHAEEPIGMVEAAAYRYKEGRAAWESEKPWEPTTLAHGAVLLERKALSAAGTFKGDSQAYYLALTVEPLYTSPPAPVSVVLPCDVRVAPATTIRKGCKVETLMQCIELRKGQPDKFTRFKSSAPPATVSIEIDEREEFETWVRREWPQAPLSNIRDLLPFHDPRYGEYCDEPLQRAWVGWQARACLDKVKELYQ